MDGTSTSREAEWKTAATFPERHGLGPPGQNQDDGTTIEDEGERLVWQRRIRRSTRSLARPRPLLSGVGTVGTVGTVRNPRAGRDPLRIGGSASRIQWTLAPAVREVTTRQRLPAAGVCPPTPLEVGHHIGPRQRRLGPRAAECRDQSEGPIRPRGREKRALRATLPGSGHAADRRDAGPQMENSRPPRGGRRSRPDREAGDAARGVVTGPARSPGLTGSSTLSRLRHPTRPAPISGPRSPSPPGMTRAPRHVVNRTQIHLARCL